MILDIPIIAQLPQQQRQALIINKNLMRANRKRIPHDYQPDNRVLILSYQPANKLEPRASIATRSVFNRSNMFCSFI
jgi:hypothetical protein